MTRTVPQPENRIRRTEKNNPADRRPAFCGPEQAIRETHQLAVF
ncbi:MULTISPECIES: hypothetical protein [Actinomycetes]|nr:MULTISPECIES: hypothetical protein [Actinomycetes]